MQFSDDIVQSLLQQSDALAVAELCDPSSEWFKEWLADDVWHTEITALAVAAVANNPPEVRAASKALWDKVRADALQYIRGEGWEHAHRCYQRLRDGQQ